MKWRHLFFALAIFAAADFADAERPLVAKVVKVVDGDTIKIETNIRLSGVDCPETKQEGGLDATEYLADLVEGRRVVLHLEKRGYYGRFVAKPFTKEGADIGAELIGEGLCWSYHRETTPEYRALEEKAKESEVGIWKKNPQSPWAWRKDQRKKRSSKRRDEQ